MTNSELAKEIIRVAEENHINLYHSVSKVEFYKKFDKFLEKADNLTEPQFDYNMLKLFALFKDGHTGYEPCNDPLYLDKYFWWSGEDLILMHEDKAYKVNAINGKETKWLSTKIGQLVCTETEQSINRRINGYFNNGYTYVMLNLTKGEPLNVDCTRDDKPFTLKVNLLTREMAKKSQEKSKSILSKKQKFYEFEIINDDILYIRYRACREDPEYTIEQFNNDIAEKLKECKVKGYIFDITNNGGGSEKIIRPVIKRLPTLKVPGAVIINRGVYSGAMFAVRDLKESGAVLIGEPTGGALGTYGNNGIFTIERKKIIVSTTYFDKEHRFATHEKGYDGTKDKNYGKPYKPDIYVPFDIKDLETHANRALLTAIEYINKHSSNERQL